MRLISRVLGLVTPLTKPCLFPFPLPAAAFDRLLGAENICRPGQWNGLFPNNQKISARETKPEAFRIVRRGRLDADFYPAHRPLSAWETRSRSLGWEAPFMLSFLRTTLSVSVASRIYR